MEFPELVDALMRNDALAARQWVMDAARAKIDWSAIPDPRLSSRAHMAVAAGVAEMLAERSGQPAPSWTSQVGPADEPVYLVKSAEKMPRLRKVCEEEGPAPLRRRRVLAPPDFLTAA